MSAAAHDMGMSEGERRARLERALDWGGNTHSVADVVQACRDGKAQYWQRGDGMILTEIHEFPRLKVIHYWLIWGALDDCLALEDEINAWAREQGCTVATAMGRKGWGRVAAPTGWKPWHPNFIKRLEATQ